MAVTAWIFKKLLAELSVPTDPVTSIPSRYWVLGIRSFNALKLKCWIAPTPLKDATVALLLATQVNEDAIVGSPPDSRYKLKRIVPPLNTCGLAVEPAPMNRSIPLRSQ